MLAWSDHQLLSQLVGRLHFLFPGPCWIPVSHHCWCSWSLDLSFQENFPPVSEGGPEEMDWLDWSICALKGTQTTGELTDIFRIFPNCRVFLAFNTDSLPTPSGDPSDDPSCFVPIKNPNPKLIWLISKNQNLRCFYIVLDVFLLNPSWMNPA